MLHALILTASLAQAHHMTNTTTGALIRHFVSAQTVTRSRLTVYFVPDDPLAVGETLIARWIPPVLSDTCRVFEQTVPDGKPATHIWNSAAINRYCPGAWLCEIIARKPGPPVADRVLHVAVILAKKPD